MHIVYKYPLADRYYQFVLVEVRITSVKKSKFKMNMFIKKEKLNDIHQW